MANENDINDFGEQVIAAIKSGNVKMRPKWYFRLQNVLIAVAIVIIMLIAVFFASFVIFVLHERAGWLVPLFGLAGWYSLFNALPLVLVVLSLFFIGVLAFLMKKYPIGNQWPLLYSFLAMLFIVVAASFVFIQTSLYNELFGTAVPQDMPFFGAYYPGVGVLESDDIHRGEITAISGHGFTLRDALGKASPVLIGSASNIPAGITFKIGDMVVVFGDVSPTGTVVAAGVEELAK